uniref:MFS domain-containing protein n=1 Tax=Macrostomum lignano TaxID=282301 RepID=A0A1I8FGM7_9PLAT
LLGLDFVLGTPDRWFYLMSLTLLPSCLQLLVLPFCPESPRHLLLDKSDSRLARSALVQLRGEARAPRLMRNCPSWPERPTAAGAHESPQAVVHASPALPTASSLCYAAVPAAVRHQCHILIGQYDQKTATYATIGIGCVNVLVTFVSAAIVDKAGRRTLHMCGLAGMCLSAGALTVSLVLHHNFQPVVYSCVAFIYIYVAPIPWFIVAEMFNQAARPVAVSVAVLVNWAGQILIGMGYPPVL